MWALVRLVSLVRTRDNLTRQINQPQHVVSNLVARMLSNCKTVLIREQRDHFQDEMTRDNDLHNINKIITIYSSFFKKLNQILSGDLHHVRTLTTLRLGELQLLVVIWDSSYFNPGGDAEFELCKDLTQNSLRNVDEAGQQIEDDRLVMSWMAVLSCQDWDAGLEIKIKIK